jgi:hypothetical protein
MFAQFIYSALEGRIVELENGLLCSIRIQTLGRNSEVTAFPSYCDFEPL